MIDLLTAAADTHPGGVFLVDEKSQTTFMTAEKEVATRAAALGDRIGSQIVIRPRLAIDSVIELLAAIRAGATAVLLAERGPAPLIERMQTSALLDSRPAQTIVFTSGSSGLPKGVRLSARNWHAAAVASAGFYDYGPSDRWLCVLPLHHVGGLSIIFRSLLSGGTVLLAPRLHPSMLGEVELASLVATQVRRLLADGFARPTHLRTLLIGGGPIASDLIHSANRMDLPVVPTYGMTETAAVVASARVGDSHGRLYPLPGVEMSTAEDGRVLVRGEQVSPGYVDGPERADGEWFTTSDLGTFADDGSVEITGRADRVIITGGEKVEPELVEALLSRHPGVEEVAVVGITDRKWGETVVAYYAGDASPQDLDLVARAGLVPAAVPKRFIRVEHLPRTELGKVQLSALF